MKKQWHLFRVMWEKTVIPIGKTVGIYVNTKGILVIDTGEVTDLYGNMQQLRQKQT